MYLFNNSIVFLFLVIRQPPTTTLFPYTTLFRSFFKHRWYGFDDALYAACGIASLSSVRVLPLALRSEEHTSELQSRRDLVCRLLLEKKKVAKFLRLLAFFLCLYH